MCDIEISMPVRLFDAAGREIGMTIVDLTEEELKELEFILIEGRDLTRMGEKFSSREDEMHIVWVREVKRQGLHVYMYINCSLYPELNGESSELPSLTEEKNGKPN